MYILQSHISVVRTLFHRGGSNEYPQSMFWSKNKKNSYTPAYPVLLYKSGVQGVDITRTCFRDVEDLVENPKHFLSTKIDLLNIEHIFLH